jgi:NFU1 iron-sulfur cluster scaffold homolog, mitochondrial
MSEQKKIPVAVYSEMTPNPSTMKFVANKMLIEDGATAEYLSLEDTKDSSKLAEELFQFPFVKGVFIARNFITITKNDRIKWEYVTNELRVFITNYLSVNLNVVTKLPEPKVKEEVKEDKTISQTIEPIINSDNDRAIVDLLEEFVRPAVEGDGGAIHFQSFDEETGKVTVVLKGACSGCPSSTATLKGGIENLLRNHIPQVREVVALEA